MEMILNVASWASIALGLFFMLVGTFGLLRMPDIYTRLHAAGMTDTMGAGFLLLAMALQTVVDMMHGQTDYWSVLVRLVLVYGFLLITSPIASHALARAGIAGGVEPWADETEAES